MKKGVLTAFFKKGETFFKKVETIKNAVSYAQSKYCDGLSIDGVTPLSRLKDSSLLSQQQRSSRK